MTSWSATMDLGIVHALAFPECRLGDGPVIETLTQIVNDADFGAVEIAPVRDPAVRAQAQALLSWSGLQVVYLPILPMLFDGIEIASEDEGRRKASMRRLHDLIDEAVAFDSALAMIGAPPDPGPGKRAPVIERLIEDIQELCDYAGSKSTNRQLHITLEPFDRDVEKKRIIGPTAEAAALADAVDRDNFGITVDLSHLPLLGETADSAIGAAGRHLIHAHIGNCVVDDPACPFFGDFHPRFDHPLGRNGEAEVTEYLHQLDAHGFWENARSRLGSVPILSMEVKPNQVDNETSGAIIVNGKRTFARSWAKSRTGSQSTLAATA